MGVACQDGRIKEIVNWKKGRRDGKFMSFEDGHPHVSGTYRQNAKNGEWIQYDENGRITLSRNYRNDVPEGVARRYYPNGRVYIHMNYHDGIPDGYYVMYAESGEPIVEAFLKNGHFEAVKRYNPNCRRCISTLVGIFRFKCGLGRYVSGQQSAARFRRFVPLPTVRFFLGRCLPV